MSTADTKAQIIEVIAGFQREVPSLAKLKLVFELEHNPLAEAAKSFDATPGDGR